MSIETNIFRRCVVDFSKLEKYGFAKSAAGYVYTKLLLDGDFKATVFVNADGNITGEVYDTANDDVYLPLRVEEMAAGYAGKVRTAYETVLMDIKQNCCNENLFAFAQSNRIVAAIRQNYGDEPDFPWGKYDTYGVFRNPDNAKWYALIMTVDKSKIEPSQHGNIEIINLKLDINKIPELIKNKGFYQAYHMNKKYWITLTLDDSLDDETIWNCIEESRAFTLAKKQNRPPQFSSVVQP